MEQGHWRKGEKMLKVKDWKKNQNAQFIPLLVHDNGDIIRARRIVDGAVFTKEGFYRLEKEFKESLITVTDDYLISLFHKDLIHVGLNVYTYLDGNMEESTDNTIEINEVKFPDGAQFITISSIGADEFK